MSSAEGDEFPPKTACPDKFTSIFTQDQRLHFQVVNPIEGSLIGALPLADALQEVEHSLSQGLW